MKRLLPACFCALSLLPAARSADAPPNVVLIVVDDLGYADLGIHGSKEIATPNMDSLAHDGVRFTSGYVTAPLCAPSRAGFLTGRWQNHFGFEYNPEPGVAWGLPTTEKTIAERLKPLGYATGIFGKWHQGETPEFHPLKRGFDEFYGFLSAMHSYFKSDDGKWGKIYRGTEPVELDKYLTQAIADESVSFIDRHKEKPFFLYVAFNAPHIPGQVPEGYLAQIPEGITDPVRRTYLAMVRALDDGVGSILAALHKNELDKNTLVVFFSDNGGALLAGAAANGACNAPLRGGKAELWEGGIRVPFFMRWTDHIPAGRVLDGPVISLDVLPSLLALAGAPADPTLDGVNILPWVEGKAPVPADRKPFFWKFYGRIAVREGGLKMIRPDYEKNLELYDLPRDISETKDIASDHPERVSAMRAEYDEWEKLNPKPLDKTESSPK
ncbi:MAG: sulfatase [Verrucomicrobiaceae bacterium]|nr:MAG: sulfatase [Verrucomicrobiaceae bacterium]